MSPDAKAFYLSKEARIQLQVILRDFPKIGSATAYHEIGVVTGKVDITDAKFAECGSSKCTLLPPNPKELPTEATKDNVPKMKEWLFQRYASSSFNKCSHQVFPEMAGPLIKIHFNPKGEPVFLLIPVPVALHWQEQVKKELFRDVKLGAIEPAPYREQTKWFQNDNKQEAGWRTKKNSGPFPINQTLWKRGPSLKMSIQSCKVCTTEVDKKLPVMSGMAVIQFL